MEDGSFTSVTPLLFLLMFFIILLFWLNTVFEEDIEIYAQYPYKISVSILKSEGLKSEGVAFLSNISNAWYHSFPLIASIIILGIYSLSCKVFIFTYDWLTLCYGNLFCVGKKIPSFYDVAGNIAHCLLKFKKGGLGAHGSELSLRAMCSIGVAS